jgi:hypothetical protein
MMAPRGRRSHIDHYADRWNVARDWITLPSPAQFWKLPPAEIFKACKVQERRFEAINGKQFLESLDRMRLFEAPVFSEEPESRARKAHEFRLLITRPQGSQPDWRYTELVKELKKLQDAELRWLLIARWVESEGICKAEELLPKETLGRLLKRAKNGRLKVTPGDLRLARLIRIWLPYFERLLHDRAGLLKKRRGMGVAMKELSGLGYVENAVVSTIGKRESVQAVISWLTLREAYNAKDHTLQVAYSRVEAAKRKADSKFNDGLAHKQHGKRHLHQIDAFEFHNFLHLIS